MRKLPIIVLVILVLGLIVGPAIPYYMSDEYVVTVTDKLAKRTDDTDQYLVFTKLEDGSVRVFKNADSLIKWKCNSSDVYATIEKGKKYRVRAYGWRIQACSSYENIVEITPYNGR